MYERDQIKLDDADPFDPFIHWPRNVTGADQIRSDHSSASLGAGWQRRDGSSESAQSVSCWPSQPGRNGPAALANRQYLCKL